MKWPIPHPPPPPPPPMTNNYSDLPRVQSSQVELLGWPTDMASIDYFGRRPWQESKSSKKVSAGGANTNADANNNNHHQHDPLSPPHTVLILIPGNPGQYDWYISDLVRMISRLGGGYAARAVSHAGHGLGRTSNSNNSDDSDGGGYDDGGGKESGIVDVQQHALMSPFTSNPAIPWTVDGQVQHKIAYLDHIMVELDDANARTQKKGQQQQAEAQPAAKFVFLGHSFGCHVLQRVLLVRPDILSRTIGCLYLMPFVRMDADTLFNQWKLDVGAAHPEVLIALGTYLSRFLQIMPEWWVNHVIVKWLGGIHQNDSAREIAVKLLRQPNFVKNFFQLGTQEIRDIPRQTDVAAYRFIAGWYDCPIHMLFAGNDQWAPRFHMDDIQEMQSRNVLPGNGRIVMTYMPEVKHDYVTVQSMSDKVVDWCLHSIQAIVQAKGRAGQSPLRSRL